MQDNSWTEEQIKENRWSGQEQVYEGDKRWRIEEKEIKKKSNQEDREEQKK